MDKIVVTPLQKIRVPEILDVLTKAYTGNPAHIAIFGKDNFLSNKLFFSQILKTIRSDLFVVESAGSIIGVTGIIIHPRPASAGPESRQFTAKSLSAPESVITRLQERQAIWDKNEPKERHYHFGPVAVLPEYQHKGIGSSMMEYCCNILDREGEPGYLETESVENCQFYSKFGFQVIHETVLFGIPSFFMKRLKFSTSLKQ
ncbi:MAG: GNAT family N-acetyltransferase [Dehalococcoidales bacterium]|nr:GNAT family N-acetyltransferase [Dehalococcoidales bacterium]